MSDVPPTEGAGPRGPISIFEPTTEVQELFQKPAVEPQPGGSGSSTAGSGGYSKSCGIQPGAASPGVRWTGSLDMVPGPAEGGPAEFRGSACP